MCYMSEGGKVHVGVRELRQNLSVYLDRVKAGESLTVTEHGRVVARLVPASAGESAIDRLIADGHARRGRGSLADLGPPQPSLGPPLSEILRQMRDEERS